MSSKAERLAARNEKLQKNPQLKKEAELKEAQSKESQSKGEERLPK